eukprot:7566514-Alexandrium_andersonii.AAC.1
MRPRVGVAVRLCDGAVVQLWPRITCVRASAWPCVRGYARLCVRSFVRPFGRALVHLCVRELVRPRGRAA